MYVKFMCTSVMGVNHEAITNLVHGYAIRRSGVCHQRSTRLPPMMLVEPKVSWTGRIQPHELDVFVKQIHKSNYYISITNIQLNVFVKFSTKASNVYEFSA